jgi:hypothetical protein
MISIEARKKLVRCSGEEIVRGIVLATWEPRRATLVKLELVVSTPCGRV